MEQVEQQLKRTGEKLLQLLRQYHSLQKENEKLIQENHEMAARLQAISIESDKWQQQSQILKLAKEEMSETDKKAFEKRLSQYVREIDQCISMLNE